MSVQQLRKILTLVLVKEDNRVLLGLKKRGFGKGKWNGFGGKVESGETIEQSAIRELKEESNLIASDMTKIGILNFEFVNDPVMLEVHVFFTSSYEGSPKETEEMKPQWYPLHSIPYDKMWADDQHWFPLFLKGSKFQGWWAWIPGFKCCLTMEATVFYAPRMMTSLSLVPCLDDSIKRTAISKVNKHSCVN